MVVLPRLKFIASRRTLLPKKHQKAAWVPAFSTGSSDIIQETTLKYSSTDGWFCRVVFFCIVLYTPTHDAVSRLRWNAWFQIESFSFGKWPKRVGLWVHWTLGLSELPPNPWWRCVSPSQHDAPIDLGPIQGANLCLGSLIVLNMLLSNLQRGSKSDAKESNFSGDRKMRCSCAVEAVHSCTKEKTNTWKMYCISRALPQHCHCICGSSLGWLAFWWKLSRRWPPWSMSRSEWTWPRQCTSQIWFLRMGMSQKRWIPNDSNP